MIPLFKVFMPKSVKKPLLKTLFSGYIGQGPQVEKFENALKKYIGNPYALTLNSATSALHLSLKLANVGPGDEVITTPLTCTATNWPILAQGANIVWADIDPATGNLDPQSIRQKITKKTKAIMVVDWGGQPADITKIKKIANFVPIIEDAAHAFGALYNDKKVGNYADYTCFSFQAIKHITTVDGGLLCVSTKGDYKRAKLLRWYGIDREKSSFDSRVEIDVNEWGYKYHMNDVAATIGINGLQYIDEILKKQRDNADCYLENLKNIKGLTLLKPQTNSLSSYWLFTILVEKRDQFREYMATYGITTSQVHRRNDTHPVVKKFKTHLPSLDRFEKKMICIPVGWWLSQKDIKYIIKTIKNGW